MITLYSQTLTRPELDRFLTAARATPYFKPASGGGTMTMRRSLVPALPGYRFSPFMNPGITYRGPFEDSFFERSLALIDAIGPVVVGMGASVHAAEADQPRPPEYGEEEELSRLGFGSNEAGAWIRYAPANLPPIGGSRTAQARTFNGAFAVLGLGGDLEATAHDGRLRLEVKTDQLILPPRHKPLSEYVDRAKGRLVSVNVCELDGTNFGEVTLNTFTLEELRGKVASLIAHIGPEKIVGPASFSLSVRPERLEEIRPLLNASGFMPWEISLSVESGYTLDDLDRAVVEHDSFMLLPFHFRVPKAGEMDVYLHYEKPNFSLDFSFFDTTPKKFERLKSAILEVARADDFVREAKE